MKLRIATRASEMALAQARFVKQVLAQHHKDLHLELVPITTEGDRHLSVMLSRVGGKGLFLKELEQALLSKEADIAVHSLKDMTVDVPEGLTLAAYCERFEVRDASVGSTLEALPANAVVGTASLRRTCLVNASHAGLVIKPVRGNVQTRLKKLAAGEYDALLLSAAGLVRVGLGNHITAYLSPDQFVPAVGQGVIAVECREDDAATLARLHCLDHEKTRQAVLAERALNKHLNGGCHVPIAGYAIAAGDALQLTGLVGQLDGKKILRETQIGSFHDPISLGKQVAERLLSQGADRILKAIYHG